MKIMTENKIMHMTRDFLLLFPLAVWIGGGIALGFFAAPVAFADLPSRTLAGNVMGTILYRFEWVLYAAMICLIIAEAIKYAKLPEARLTREIWITILIAVFILSQLFAIFVVNTNIEALRAQIASFDLPFDQDPNPLRKSFGMWHGFAVLCSLVGIIIGSIILFLKFVFPAPKES